MSQIQVQLQETMGSDRSIANSAWTSSANLIAKELRSDKDVARVVNMLADAGHSTPFESVVCRFWIKMPVATDRQHVTHRIASHNGLSGRYRRMPDDYLAMPPDVAAICRKLPGGHEIVEDYAMLCEAANDAYRTWTALAKESADLTSNEYKRAREFLRGVLPQHNMVERVSIFNLRSLANYFRLRLDPAAQPEIREVARQMLAQLKQAEVCPVALSALERNGWQI